jgi:hypothetical protein
MKITVMIEDKGVIYKRDLEMGEDEIKYSVDLHVDLHLRMRDLTEDVLRRYMRGDSDRQGELFEAITKLQEIPRSKLRELPKGHDSVICECLRNKSPHIVHGDPLELTSHQGVIHLTPRRIGWKDTRADIYLGHCPECGLYYFSEVSTKSIYRSTY